jgi:type II secretory pathway component PulK
MSTYQRSTIQRGEVARWWGRVTAKCKHTPTTSRPHHLTTRRRAVVLLVVLVVVAVLTLAAFRYSQLMHYEYNAAQSATRAIQAQALADSGIYYTAALLSNHSTFASVLNSTPWNNWEAFKGILVQPNDRAHFRGRFSIISPPGPDDPLGNDPHHRFGVTDEGGKINLNALMILDPRGKALHDRLMVLPNMTEEIADAIVDWIDGDNLPRANGAEDSYYQSLTPPYHCKNGPLDSLEELLLVRGVTPELLFGNDHNRNGVLDPKKEDNGSGLLDHGWSAYLTIYSREQDLDSQNNLRIYVNSSDVKSTYEKLVNAVGQDLAYYIAAYRLYGPAANPQQQQAQAQAGQSQPSTGSDTTKQSGATPAPAQTTKTSPQKVQAGASAGAAKKTTSPSSSTTNTQPKKAGKAQRDDLDFSKQPAKTIASLYELIGTMVNVPDKQGGTTEYECPLNDEGTLRQSLPLLLDQASTRNNPEIPARVNINTAPVAVLAGLPGLAPSDVETILSLRPNLWSSQAPDPIFQTPAWLIIEANFTPAAMQKLEKYITTRSQTYRLQALGYFDQGDPAMRVEAVIDTNAGRPRIVYRRDLTELGKGFNVEK